MRTISTFFGKYKVIPITLGIVVCISLAARIVHAATMTDQQKAALDIPVQQAIIEKNRAAAAAFTGATLKLSQDAACVADASQCPLASGQATAQ
jgi:hypothetical protein